MTITPHDLAAMRARDRAFGDGESEATSDIAMDRRALLDHCAALEAALSSADRAALVTALRDAIAEQSARWARFVSMPVNDRGWERARQDANEARMAEAAARAALAAFDGALPDAVEQP